MQPYGIELQQQPTPKRERPQKSTKQCAPYLSPVHTKIVGAVREGITDYDTIALATGTTPEIVCDFLLDLCDELDVLSSTHAVNKLHELR